MSSAGGNGGFRQSLRGLSDRTPLRVKMITAVLALVIIALTIVSFASRAVFSGYLYRQAEGRLQNYYSQVEPYLSSELGQQQGPFGGRRNADLLDVGTERTWLLGSQGQQIRLPGEFGTPGSPPQIPQSQSWLTANARKAVTVAGPSGGDKWLVITQQIPNTPVTNSTTGHTTFQTVTLVVGTDLGNISQSINYLTEIDLLVSAAVVIILAMIGIAVVRASLRPLTDIEKTAAAIAGGDLSSRVPERDPRTEVGSLGRSLNAMLAQIEAAFRDRTRSEEAARMSEQRMRQFLADASHELRTPLTAIRGFAEYYRQRGGVAEIAGAPRRPALTNRADQAPTAPRETAGTSAETDAAPEPAANGEGPLGRGDLDRIMQRVEQESSRMGVLVEDMLLLARLDQQRPVEQRPVDMLTLAADAVHDARVVAPARDISLTVGAGTALIVQGDEVRLRQVIGNLMTNAINHTPDGTPISVGVRSGTLNEWRAAASVATAARWAPPGARAGRPALAVAGHGNAPAFPAAILEVADSGPGLTQQQAEHVFERFYRADQARTRRSGGAGLGLAIVAALVAAHGGVVWVQSLPGGGATFRIAIPLAPEARYAGPEPDEGDEPDIIGWDGRLVRAPALRREPGQAPAAGADQPSAGPPAPRG